MIQGNIMTEKNGVIKHYKNTTTTLFDRMVLSNGIGAMISSNMGDEMGTSYNMNPQRQGVSSYRLSSLSKNNMFCIYLCNLTSDEQAALSKNSNFNPLINSDGEILMDKIIGWATCAYSGTSNKEGTLKTMKGTIGVDLNKNGISFHWAPGKMNGTFNTILLGTNIFNSKRAGGFVVCRGLEMTNALIGENQSSGYFLTNNVQDSEGNIITGPSEILVGDGNNTQNSRILINLETGAITVLESTDVRYNIPLYNVPHAYIGEGRIIADDTSSVYVYNVKTKTSIKTFSGRGFILKDNLIYVKNTSSSNVQLLAYSIETLNAVSASNITWTLTDTYSSVGSLYISNFGNNYLLTPLVFNSQPSMTDGGLVFSDITNPEGSVVGYYNGVLGSNVINATGLFRYIFNKTQDMFKIGDLSEQLYNTAGTLVNIDRAGIKIIDSNGFGNLLTYAFLSTPETIEITEGYDLDYYWNL